MEHGVVAAASLLLLKITSVVQVCPGPFSVEWVIHLEVANGAELMCCRHEVQNSDSL